MINHISNCGDCSWFAGICLKTQKRTDAWSGIPEWCPLPDVDEVKK